MKATNRKQRITSCQLTQPTSDILRVPETGQHLTIHLREKCKRDDIFEIVDAIVATL
jgi:hypothetical protein